MVLPVEAEALLSRADGALISALYVARCKDCGLQPSQSGARRFHAEVAAVQPSLERVNATRQI